MTPSLTPTKATAEETLAVLMAQPQYSDRFKEVLRDRAPQFMSSVVQIGRSLGKDVEPRSIIASAMIAAALDLPIDRNLGFAWIVAYKDGGTKYAQCQIGWKGFVQLAQRSGQYKNISVPRAINKEAFMGYDSIGVPIIDWNLVDETKDTIGYAFGWRLINGGESVFFWEIEKIKAHAQRYSQAYRSGKQSPWQTHFPEMCKKTVVKNSLSQFGILSIQMATAVKMDQAVMTDMDREPLYLDNSGGDEETNERPSLEEPREEAKPKEETKTKPWDRSRKPAPSPTPESVGDAIVEQVSAEHAEAEARRYLNGLLEMTGVAFEDFRQWLISSGKIWKTDALDPVTIANMDGVPGEVCLKAMKDPIGMGKMVKLYETKQGPPVTL